jgi:hypothetical protein
LGFVGLLPAIADSLLALRHNFAAQMLVLRAFQHCPDFVPKHFGFVQRTKQ